MLKTIIGKKKKKKKTLTLEMLQRLLLLLLLLLLLFKLKRLIQNPKVELKRFWVRLDSRTK